MDGIDVSYIQKTVDWNRVKASDIGFVFIRIGYGKEAYQKDEQFESHYAGVKKAGILRGGYYYSYAVEAEEAKEEAKACLAMLDGKTFDLPIAYDMEEPEQFALSPQKLYEIYKAFAGVLEAEGYRCMIYTNKNWMVNKWDKTDLAKDGVKIWMAEYADVMDYRGKATISIWQNRSNASVDGIAEAVDMDLAMDGFDELYTIQTGWIKDGERWWYRFADNRYPAKQWENIDGKWYYFDDEGWMQTGWVKDKDQWYYCDRSSGAMVYDTMLTIQSPVYGAEKYAFGADGHMLVSDSRGALK